MEYEVDFLPVGEDSKSGDAIALRFGNLHGTRNEQYVVVIDGGVKSTGESLVGLIRQFYGTADVDLVVSTHADSDHINGLEVVLDEMRVHRLWMHRPSQHRSVIESALRRLEPHEYVEGVRGALEKAAELEEQATRLGIPIEDPFTGLVDPTGSLVVLGPSKDFYHNLFREAERREEVGALSRLVGEIVERLARVAESWGVETLTDDGETSPINNSSVVSMLVAGDRRLLFTADAGIPALEQVADVLDSIGHKQALNRQQMPSRGQRMSLWLLMVNRITHLGGSRTHSDDAVRTCTRREAERFGTTTPRPIARLSVQLSHFLSSMRWRISVFLQLGCLGATEISRGMF